MYAPQRFPPDLQYAATLPCEIQKSKSVTEFHNERGAYMENFLTNRWKNFENQSTFAKVIIRHQIDYFLEMQCDYNLLIVTT